MKVVGFVCAALLGLVSATAAPAADIPADLQSLLTRDFKLSPHDLVDLDNGRVVTRALPATAAGEVAAIGAVRIKASRRTFIERYKDITHFKAGPEVLEIGKFSDPPAPADLAPLTLTKDDFDLRDCRVQDCDIRLPTQAIARFQREINWNALESATLAASLFKEVLFEHVRAYTSGGPGRMVQYDDDKRTVRPVDDFAGVLTNSPYIGELVPALPEHLLHFPSARIPGAEDFLYWSKEKFGAINPFITVTHVTIAPGTATSSVITSKDVYSSRYFDASLTLTVASDAAHTPGAFYLVYVNRSRASALKGSLAGLRRAIVERRAKGSLDENLRNVRFRLERGL